jgi:hypothetical protein
VIEIFNKSKVYGSMKAMITIEDIADSQPDLVVENLSVARLTLINKGNQDLKEFLFGVTLDEGSEAFQIKSTTLDRHHIATCLTPPTVPRLLAELDFKLEPFNRNEPYTLDIYFTYYTGQAGKINLSSPHSTRFIEMGTLPRTFWDTSIEILLNITPLGAVGLSRLKTKNTSLKK